jgi:hypothetical protein
VETGSGRIYEGDDCTHCALHHALQPPRECTLCTETKTDTYLLSCGHDNCKSCISKLKKMECPVCRDSRDPIHIGAGWQEQKRRRCNNGHTHIVHDDCSDEEVIEYDREDEEDRADNE